MNNINSKFKFYNINKTLFYNEVIEETDNFIVIPTICSIVDGSIIIVSKNHFYNMLELDLKLRKEYYSLINKYREIFKNIYKMYPIIFEHGTNFYDKISVSSVVHAHTHIVNHNFNNEKELIHKMNFKTFNILDNNNDVNKSYIIYIVPNNKSFITYKFESKSQLMIYFIAKDLSLEKSYNGKITPFYENIKIKNH